MRSIGVPELFAILLVFALPLVLILLYVIRSVRRRTARFCVHCGGPLPPESPFCNHCGRQQG